MNNSAFLSYAFSIINTMQLCVLNLDYFVFQFGINCKMIYYLCNIITAKLKKLFRIFLLFMMITCSTKLQASNCIPYGTTVTLTRQSEVDSFPINYPGCDVVEGGLTISGSDIVNLNGLIGIKRIKQYLKIINNPILVNTNGLNSIKVAGNIAFDNNNSLTSITGLNNVDTISSLDIRNNYNLIQLVGLSNLKFIFDFYVYNNRSLLDFAGLNNLITMQHVYIFDNFSLKNFNGLTNLKKVGILQIGVNQSLLNFNGLNNLKIVDVLRVGGNNSLVDFIGLNNLEKINENFNIGDNSSLKNFNGLNKFSFVKYLEISNNASLKNLSGLNNLATIAIQLNIVNNISLCSINEFKSNIKLTYQSSNYFVFISDNPELSCCKKIDTIINNNPNLRVFNFDLHDNSVNCNSITEIKTITTQNCCEAKYTLLKDTICNGEQVIFNNQILKNTGTYYDTFVSNGNDSIVILELKVFNKSYQIKTLNFCIGQSFTLSDGRTISSTGIYKDTIPNFCDSIIEYRLSFLNNIIVNQTATICQGKTYRLPKGNSVQTTGVYKDTLRSAFNCDSIVITNLTVTKPIPFVNNVSICKGKNYVLPNGNSVNNTGTYYDTIRKPNTCDSIVITNLIVNPYLQSSQTATTCLGKTYTLPSGKTVTQSGIYKDTIRTITGCDSIVTTNLSITNPTPTQKSDSICEGKIYTLPSGKQVTNTGVYIDTIKKTNTCDSVIITNLSVFQNTFSVSLKSIDTIDAGNAIELKPMYSNQTAISWNWSPTTNLNCTTCEKPISTPSQNTQYSLKATAQNGCDDTAKTTIIVRQTEVYIPTAFSPNNDGINDDLTVFVNNPVAFHLVIFNRYDQKVFESVDVLNKWNGTYKNAECEVDNYVYVLDVTTANGKQHHKQGTITLLR